MKKEFKTLALIAAILVAGIFTANATNNGNVEKNAKESARREIIRNITCPEFVQENSPTNQVKAVVSVDEKGNVKVEEINSANTQLKAYVIDQLQNMKIKSTGQSQKFVLVINFQVG
jgi:hypothetical protein